MNEVIVWSAEVDPEIRHAEALRLRAHRLTYQQIAERLNFNSPQAAQYAVRAALKRAREEDAETIRGLDVERLDIMIGALMGSCEQGSLESIDRVVRIMQRKAALFGLDAPAKVANTNARGEDVPVNIDAATAGRIVAELNRLATQGAAGDSSADPAVAAEPEKPPAV